MSYLLALSLTQSYSVLLSTTQHYSALLSLKSKKGASSPNN